MVFGTDTRAGRLFDIVLLWAILLSVLEVMLESVTEIREQYRTLLKVFEWIFTVLFTIEYFVRIHIAKKPLAYVLSFYGIVDLLSILPTYFGLFISGSTYFRTIRFLRLLRIFRILKLTRYLREGDVLMNALRESKAKITVFLFGVFVIAVLVGTIMYLIEGGESGFTSIPRSIYWAIVTVTTVGFGDITPSTVLGQILASFLMIVGYGIIAVPTGIVSAEYSSSKIKAQQFRCKSCKAFVEKEDRFCKNCGKELDFG